MLHAPHPHSSGGVRGRAAGGRPPATCGGRAAKDAAHPCTACLQLKEVRWAEVEKQERTLYVTRFVNLGDAVVLSCILHQPGEAQVAAWRQLQDKYGGCVVLEQEAPTST
jgi:hypothetical protein